MDTKKQLIYAGLGLGVVGGAIYFLYSSLLSQKQEDQNRLPSDLILKMLKEYKRASLRVFLKSAEIVQRLVQQYGGSYEIQSGLTIGDIVKKDILEDLLNERTMIAQKYDLSVQLFDEALETASNEYIIEVCKWIGLSFQNAIKGISPPLDVKEEVKQKFSEEKVIQIHKQILKTSSKYFNSIFKEIKQENQNQQVDMQSDSFKQKIRKLDIHAIKTNLLREEGFEFEPESPCETFEKLAFQYKKTSNSYAEQMQRVLAIYDKIKSDIAFSEITDSQIDQLFQ